MLRNFAEELMIRKFYVYSYFTSSYTEKPFLL